MFFLTQMKFKMDGSVEKGTANYITQDEAVVQFHVAVAAAMQKEDTQKFTAVILDGDGKLVKREVWNAPMPEPEPEADSENEEAELREEAQLN